MASVVRRKAPSKRVLLLAATRKGAWIFSSDAARRSWSCDGPHFLGQIVHHLVLDPRDGRDAARLNEHGHLGPTLFRSIDLGRRWSESTRPPAFPKAAEGQAARAVDHTFWLTPGHASQPGVWYAGTSPHGLFRSEDGGDTWQPCTGLNDDPQYREWMGGPQDGTPDGPKLHSIIVDPRDAQSPVPRHVQRRRARIARWRPQLDAADRRAGSGRGLRCLRRSGCTIRIACASARAIPIGSTSRTIAASTASIGRRRWIRIGRNMPKQRRRHRLPDGGASADADKAWVFPMDGSSVWPRIALGGRPAAYVTHDGGHSWQRQIAGCRRAGLVDREAPGDDATTDGIPVVCTSARRTAKSGRAATRAKLGLHCAAPARNLRAGSRAGVMPMRVLIPSPLLSYTGAREVDADGELGADRARGSRPTVSGHPLPHRRRAGPDTSAHAGSS